MRFIHGCCIKPTDISNFSISFHPQPFVLAETICSGHVTTLTFAVSIVNYHLITNAVTSCITPSIVIARRPKHRDLYRQSTAVVLINKLLPRGYFNYTCYKSFCHQTILMKAKYFSSHLNSIHDVLSAATKYLMLLQGECRYFTIFFCSRQSQIWPLKSLFDEFHLELKFKR